jgi:hypothetical protein
MPRATGSFFTCGLPKLPRATRRAVNPTIKAIAAAAPRALSPAADRLYFPIPQENGNALKRVWEHLIARPETVPCNRAALLDL